MNVKKAKVAAALALSLVLPLGSALQAQAPTAPVSAPVSDPAAPAADVRSNTAYTLGTGDKLRITVFGEQNLTGEYAVSSTGSISFPLIGEVPAAGNTLANVQETIRQRLASGYLNDPRVAIEVLEYRTFYILGEVNKPGEYPYRSNLRIDQAVATAGGYTYRANRKRFELAPGDGTADRRVKFKEAGRLEIKPGDTVRILERFF